ncbi:MAG TPA: VIT1/CCC1 transporter family protein [Usitatibacter sp.]|nr:VIT1/CCC1 transporter family protein [Usitatibacter sp.]
MSDEIAGHQGRADRGPVLDTVERVSEMCFGLFMALTFVGAVSAATGGQEAQAAMTMFYTALGCNLAWGLVDAVMYLVRTLTDRGKRLTLAMAVRAAPDEAAAEKILREELPPLVARLVGDEELKAIRRQLVSHRLPDKPRFHARDFKGALGIFVIVVLSTFPVALPFIVVKDVPTALFVSRVLSVLMLFGGGYALGRHAGYSGWKAGFGMAVMGVLLTMAVIALGG